MYWAIVLPVPCTSAVFFLLYQLVARRPRRHDVACAHGVAGVDQPAAGVDEILAARIIRPSSIRESALPSGTRPNSAMLISSWWTKASCSSTISMDFFGSLMPAIS